MRRVITSEEMHTFGTEVYVHLLEKGTDKLLTYKGIITGSRDFPLQGTYAHVDLTEQIDEGKSVEDVEFRPLEGLTEYPVLEDTGYFFPINQIFVNDPNEQAAIE